MICPQCESAIQDGSTHHDLCGWIMEPPRPPSRYHPDPPGITLEEFGVDLFEAIKTASALAWVTKMRKAASADSQPGRIELSMQNLKRREAALSKQLADLTHRIAPEDQRRISKILNRESP